MALAVVGQASDQTEHLFALDVLDCDPRSSRLRARGALNRCGGDMLEAVLTAQQERGVRYARLDMSAVTAADQAGLTVSPDALSLRR